VDVRSKNQTPSANASATASAVGCYAVSVARWVFEAKAQFPVPRRQAEVGQRALANQGHPGDR
jgi:hypothetical protein